MTPGVISWDASMESVGFCVAAIGVFDGVHLGHQALIADASQRARRLDVPCVAVTFDRDPDQVLSPELAAGQLLTLAEKTHYLGEAGADLVCVIGFTEALAAMSPRRFLEEVLQEALNPLVVVVGHDFRFGHRATGDVLDLKEFGGIQPFTVVDRELVSFEGSAVTSTRIRELISGGEVETASLLLGRSHRVHGVVVHGRGDGAKMGVPTANVIPFAYAAVPGPGVYAGEVSDGIGSYAAAISVGVPPSFPGAHDAIEAHLIGFEGDLYGHELRVEFVRRIRDHLRFESTEELVARIRQDLTEVAAKH